MAARALVLAVLVVLAGCATVVREEVPPAPVPSDGRGDADLRADSAEYEPDSTAGHDELHTVLRPAYFLRGVPSGYESRGIASWYGRRFHGRPTSSGEIYDMYQLSAAHRSLPLPSFAEVRHLDNGRSVLVRVNDRGPAHRHRLIDVSWAAAVQLGIAQSGTAAVEVRAISFDEPVSEELGLAHLPVMLQLGSFDDPELATSLVDELQQAGVSPVLTERAETEHGSIWQVRVGPVLELLRARQLVDEIMALGFAYPRYVYP